MDNMLYEREGARVTVIEVPPNELRNLVPSGTGQVVIDLDDPRSTENMQAKSITLRGKAERGTRWLLIEFNARDAV